MEFLTDPMPRLDADLPLCKRNLVKNILEPLSTVRGQSNGEVIVSRIQPKTSLMVLQEPSPSKKLFNGDWLLSCARVCWRYGAENFIYSHQKNATDTLLVGLS
jgi:hypothetical protein